MRAGGRPCTAPQPAAISTEVEVVILLHYCYHASLTAIRATTTTVAVGVVTWVSRTSYSSCPGASDSNDGFTTGATRLSMSSCSVRCCCCCSTPEHIATVVFYWGWRRSDY